LKVFLREAVTTSRDTDNGPEQLKDNATHYVMFLTTACPRIGETNEGKICSMHGDANKIRPACCPFGVGYDVNSRLLDRISREWLWTSEYCPSRMKTSRLMSVPCLQQHQFASPDATWRWILNSTIRTERVRPSIAFLS